MQDYGHWKTLKDVDISNYLGFVYVITFDNGKKYVGAKKIWKRIKVPPSSFKRGPRKGFEESDWKSYTSSSKEVNDMISSGVHPREYLIVGWYDSWGKTLLAEAEMQFSNDVLRNPEWLNKQIGGHFNPNCFDDLTYDDIERYMTFDKGNEHTNWPVMYKVGSKTKYVNPDDVEKHLQQGWQFGRSRLEKLSVICVVSKYKLYNTETGEVVEVINQNDFARQNNIESGHLTNLLKGSVDSVGKWTLLPEVRRRNYVIEDDKGNKFSSVSECERFNGLSRGNAASLCKKGIYKKIVPESRTLYKKRLASVNYVETCRVESVSKVTKNSFRDVVPDLASLHDSKESSIIWLEQYISYLKATK